MWSNEHYDEKVSESFSILNGINRGFINIFRIFVFVLLKHALRLIYTVYSNKNILITDLLFAEDDAVVPLLVFIGSLHLYIQSLQINYQDQKTKVLEQVRTV